MLSSRCRFPSTSTIFVSPLLSPDGILFQGRVLGEGFKVESLWLSRDVRSSSRLGVGIKIQVNARASWTRAAFDLDLYLLYPIRDWSACRLCSRLFGCAGLQMYSSLVGLLLSVSLILLLNLFLLALLVRARKKMRFSFLVFAYFDDVMMYVVGVFDLWVANCITIECLGD